MKTQQKTNRRAEDVEKQVRMALTKELDHLFPGMFSVEKKPRIKNIYREKEQSWSMVLDFSIRNKINGKTLFGEVKNQGDGNLHERLCRYFAPGVMSTLRDRSHVSEKVLPFWVVLTGEITKIPKRKCELATWFTGCREGYYLWEDMSDTVDLVNHFVRYYLKYLL